MNLPGDSGDGLLILEVLAFKIKGEDGELIRPMDLCSYSANRNLLRQFLDFRAF